MFMMNDSTEEQPSSIPLWMKVLTCTQIAVRVFFAYQNYALYRFRREKESTPSGASASIQILSSPDCKHIPEIEEPQDGSSAIALFNARTRLLIPTRLMGKFDHHDH
jgi:hypothetical protein